jgi:hypothetical protein
LRNGAERFEERACGPLGKGWEKKGTPVQ